MKVVNKKKKQLNSTGQKKANPRAGQWTSQIYVHMHVYKTKNLSCEHMKSAQAKRGLGRGGGNNYDIVGRVV